MTKIWQLWWVITNVVLIVKIVHIVKIFVKIVVTIVVKIVVKIVKIASIFDIVQSTSQPEAPLDEGFHGTAGLIGIFVDFSTEQRGGS